MRSSRASGRGSGRGEEGRRTGTSNLHGTEESRLSREHLNPKRRIMLLLLRALDCDTFSQVDDRME